MSNHTRELYIPDTDDHECDLPSGLLYPPTSVVICLHCNRIWKMTKRQRWTRVYLWNLVSLYRAGRSL